MSGLNGYKLHKEHDYHYEIQHPDGSRFMIAKEGLSPETHHAIQNFDEGGEVQSQDTADQSYQNATGGNSEDLMSASFAGAPDVPTAPIPDDKSANNATPQELDNLKNNLQVKQQSDTTQQQPSPPMDTSATAPNAPKSMMEQYTENEQKTEAAIGALGKAQSQGLAAQAKIHNDLADQNAARDQIYQQNLSNIEKENEDLFQNAKQGKVDHYWANRSIPDKITAVAALFLGGLASGLNGGPNTAADLINKSIDQDMEVQKANIAQSNNLLRMNLERTHNMEQAELMTRQQLATVAQAKIAAIAEQSGSQESIQKANILGLQQHQTYLGNMQQMAQFQTKSQIMNGNSNAAINPAMLSDKDAARMVVLPNGTQKFAHDEKGADDLRKTEYEADRMQNTINKMRELQKGGRSLPNTDRSKQAERYRNDALSSLNKIEEYSRFSPEVMESLRSQIPDATAWRQDNVTNSLNDLEQNLGNARESAREQTLFGYKKPNRNR